MPDDGEAEKAAAKKVADRIRGNGKSVKQDFVEAKKLAEEKKKV